MNETQKLKKLKMTYKICKEQQNFIDKHSQLNNFLYEDANNFIYVKLPGLWHLITYIAKNSDVWEYNIVLVYYFSLNGFFILLSRQKRAIKWIVRSLELQSCLITSLISNEMNFSIAGKKNKMLHHRSSTSVLQKLDSRKRIY